MVVVLFHDRIALLVMRHLRPKTLLKVGKVNFLGFYIVDFKGLSYHTHGLLGMAYIVFTTFVLIVKCYCFSHKLSNKYIILYFGAIEML